ncbi:MAG: TusE/DsrC/DsvC family sulfur relay protein [Thiobacillus sp.]|jgi:tRNA 2-thiouridine synthesizing protein E|nr:TusE/DsrC/DsvC family sulfur relay protein [Thiobacillus sp.]
MMSITVNGKNIETDEAGFLKNPDDWNEDVAEVLAKEHEKAGHKHLNETAMGLVYFFREYYKEKLTHPSMNDLMNTLGKQSGQSFSDAEAYKKFLYDMFPHGPVQMLCKLAGLPNPGVENQS